MIQMPSQEFIFNALVTNVVDGDTIDCSIDMGLHCYRKERLRILRINAPEMKGATREAGLAAKAFVIGWLKDQTIRIQTYKSDAFGRYLAEIWRISDGKNLSDDMLEAGMAVPFYGG